MAAFHHLNDAALDQVMRAQAVDALAEIFDAAFGNFTALGPQKVRDGFQGRGLARAVRPEGTSNDTPFSTRIT
jgi:hypothetical protein